MNIEINQQEKNRLLEFINENDLDYTPIDNNISKFHIISHDGLKFFFYKYNEEYIITKYDPKKDIVNKPSSIAYEYSNYKTLPQVLEQLSFYDNSIHKTYWVLTIDSIQIEFIKEKENYIDNWYQDFIKDEYWTLEDCETYKTIIYNNSNYNPVLRSPYNTLHEVSEINNISYNNLDRLYFEIHPISCLEKRESYLLKLLCNDNTFKEYFNYKVSSKKGLKLLIDDIFESLKIFKV